MNETPVADTQAVVANPIKAKEDPLKDIKAKLTDDEKENFFKMFVSDQPYVDSVSSFGGKMKLTFNTLSVAKNNRILQQQQKDNEEGIVRTNDGYVIRVIQYRIAASLLAINDEPFCPLAADENEDSFEYLIKRVEEINKWPTFKLSNITDAYNKFEQKVFALTEESFKENF